MTAALTLAAEILANTDSVNLRVRAFDRRGLRFSKSELVAVAANMNLDTSGSRSNLCFRIARS
jgi:hypothetical protein